ncbi:MAG: hypothetical protein PHR16_08850 [Methylovulum sp.]|nr:hypothetical protein [Methylovulum sp.]
MKPLLIPLFFICSFIAVTATIANDDGQRPFIQALDGQPVVKLDIETQRATGIETTALATATHHAEFIAYGKAISVQPLLALRTRYLMALTQRSSAEAKLKQTAQNAKRQQDLYQHGVASKRNLQGQQAQWEADKALLDSTHFQDQSIIDEATLNWGKILTGWALSVDSDKFSVFLSGQQTLLQINVPTNHQLAGDKQPIYIDASGNRSKAQQAELISVAPQTEANMQGVGYFFKTHDKTIKPGMRISAWIPEAQHRLAGVIIPKSAVCWLMGQAFVYLKTGGEAFSRRVISDYVTTADGYFVNHGLDPGEQIVTTGAQQLLSEEMRGQIPDDD